MHKNSSNFLAKQITIYLNILSLCQQNHFKFNFLISCKQHTCIIGFFHNYAFNHNKNNDKLWKISYLFQRVKTKTEQCKTLCYQINNNKNWGWVIWSGGDRPPLNFWQTPYLINGYNIRISLCMELPILFIYVLLVTNKIFIFPGTPSLLRTPAINM